ncbi:hypothetical protein KFZ70_05910 [Tamlana fucoidanivorans]|uniref:Thiol:disulfide interchange protein DsbD N-terminal domain-containing protein n=1 Tax=Allotamlana fucoidanivorans TaxID=2583814 RepID=A0A5C4SRJ9_9FLAO|nr:protein-disulfide reductase DsbD domain-containing protein [Tamlana fucoidanivorans]TNJ46962.1 hypothetical protein FGF67_00075 [Tamlana fucoidanivorans]
MKIKFLIVFAILFLNHDSWAQYDLIRPEMQRKVAEASVKLKVLDCHSLDPLSLNALVLWSQDKSQLAVIMKINLLPGWHIYSFVPKTQPYIPTELLLELPKGIYKIGDWIKPMDEAYNDGVYIYHGVQTFVHYLKVTNSNYSNELTCGIYYQTCDLNKCYPPNEKLIKLKL